ncbi:MAG: DinB family protein [Chloroflexi bacterium]|nr:DinB family protein [Chloroflexota bacterium]
MMADAIRTLFEYQIMEDRRLWDGAIMALPETAFKIDTAYSWGTMQRECTHVVDEMHASLERLHGIKTATVAVTMEDPTREQVRATWDRVEAQWMAYMAELDDARFQQQIDIVYRDTAMTTPVWQTIFHVFNHNTLHRAEMRQMIAVIGGRAEVDRSFGARCLANSG